MPPYLNSSLYSLDESILNVYICIERPVIIDHPPSFDQQPFTLQGEKYRGREGGRGRFGLNQS